MVRAGHRQGGGVGEQDGDREGGLTIRRAFEPSSSSSLASKRYKSGIKYEHLYHRKLYECTLYLRPDRYSGSVQTAVRVRSKRQEERNSTSAPDELKLDEGA